MASQHGYQLFSGTTEQEEAQQDQEASTTTRPWQRIFFEWEW
jgi:hypothetical protein